MFEFDEFICFLLRIFVGKNFCSEFWLSQAQYCAKSYWLLISCFRPFVSELCGIVWMPNYLFRLCIYCLIEIRSAFSVNSCLSIMFVCKSCPKHWTLQLGCSYSLTGCWILVWVAKNLNFRFYIRSNYWRYCNLVFVCC